MSNKRSDARFERSFPDPGAVFRDRPKSVATIKDSCLIALDANVLLFPYGVGSKDLTDLKRAYEPLVTAERIIIPGEVAREFARIRSKKLGEIVKNLSDQNSRATPPIREVIEFLKGIDSYQAALQLSSEIEGLIKRFRDELSKVLSVVRGWRSDDPVSLLYQELFPNAVVDMSLDATASDELQEELRYRYQNKIPPGYKDASKDDGGMGDFLIWKTLLKVGSERKNDLIFVTLEKKPDWWTKADGGPVYPRFELVDEYRHASGGFTFHLLLFSEFLSHFDVEPGLIKEAKQSEQAAAEERHVSGEITRGGDLPDENVSAPWLPLLKSAVSQPEFGRLRESVISRLKKQQQILETKIDEIRVRQEKLPYPMPTLALPEGRRAFDEMRFLEQELSKAEQSLVRINFILDHLLS